MYGFLFRWVLSRIPAETAHHLSVTLLRILTAVPGVTWLMRRLLGPADPALRVRALGIDLPGPLGLAAGFDKDAVACDALAALGFGFVEIGTVTCHPQPGNPKPRLFRLTQDRALINRMGFNNGGSAEVAARLRRRQGQPAVVGVNIGKTKAIPESSAIADYVTSAERLADMASYLVINVSSPNTPGLRDLQAVEHLRPLLTEAREALDRTSRRRVPLLVKVAPDLADTDLDALADLAVELGLDGIIATNTTISRDGLRTDAATVSELGAGGLSGVPLKDRSLQVLRRLHARVGDRLVLVASGGIDDADDAWARIRAGATLIQGYTGLIYGGPLWPRQIHRGLAERVKAAGFSTIREAIGTGARHDG